MKRATMEDGRVIKLGDVVTFDIGQDCKLGKIISLDGSPDGGEITITLMEPSGNKRERSLIHDYKSGNLNVYPEGDLLSSRAWEIWKKAYKAGTASRAF